MTVVQGVPVIGGSAAEFIQMLVQRPLERRKDQWMNDVRDALIELQQRKPELDFEKLKEDEAFTTVMLAAAQAAIRTHQSEKQEALRNCVLNAAAGIDPDDSARQMFIDLVDRLTPMHLKILRLFCDPRRFEQVRNHFESINVGGLLQVINLAYPEMRSNEALVRAVWHDLMTYGLLERVELGLMMSGRGCLERRTSYLGDRFVAFVCNHP